MAGIKRLTAVKVESNAEPIDGRLPPLTRLPKRTGDPPDERVVDRLQFPRIGDRHGVNRLGVPRRVIAFVEEALAPLDIAQACDDQNILAPLAIRDARVIVALKRGDGEVIETLFFDI